MKTDYKNWVPKGMIEGLFCGAGVCFVGLLIFRRSDLLDYGILKIIVSAVLGIGTILLLIMGIWMFILYRQFSYSGKRKMSKQIIEGLAEYVDLPNHGVGLDIGCGSGALTIAVAKRNKNARMIGIDRWGKEYASFNKSLCENNAKAEGIDHITFKQGDALKLDFEDESFDAVCSNYVYHNIPSQNRQAILLETLRVLKKGGTFAIHDLFSKSKYGDMNTFIKELKNMDYEKVEWIDTTNGKFMSRSEAKWMMLSGSSLLIGKK